MFPGLYNVVGCFHPATGKFSVDFFIVNPESKNGSSYVNCPTRIFDKVPFAHA